MYTKYKYTGKWDDETVDKDAVIVALANNLKKEQENENTAADRPGANGSRKERGDGPTDWKLINKGANMTSPDDGKKYVWFEHYGPNNGKSGKQTGMNIMVPHNHAEWLAKNNNNNPKAWKEQQKERKEASNKRKAYFETASNTNSNAEKRGKNGKLALAKSFKSALVTKV